MRCCREYLRGLVIAKLQTSRQEMIKAQGGGQIRFGLKHFTRRKTSGCLGYFGFITVIYLLIKIVTFQTRTSYC